jgi:hypothetical protein
MRKNSVLPVKNEKELKESPLTSFGGAPIFLEFLKSIGFDRIEMTYAILKLNFILRHNILLK